MAGKVKDIIGNRYDKLVVIGFHSIKNKSAAWICRCDCGNENVIVSGCHLQTGHTRSCGCKSNKIHGMSDSNLYQTWAGIIQRCRNKNDRGYKNYGGRGIDVCDRWANSFSLFYKDMGDKPSNKYSIERIDNNGDYCPENCIWATQKKQNRNNRNNVIITYKEETMCISEWAERLNINYMTLVTRVRKWSICEALETPVRKKSDSINTVKDCMALSS